MVEQYVEYIRHAIVIYHATVIIQEIATHAFPRNGGENRTN